MNIKNPYRRPDHRQAFQEALIWLEAGCHWHEVAKLLDPDVPRYKRWQIAAKANRIVSKQRT